MRGRKKEREWLRGLLSEAVTMYAIMNPEAEPKYSAEVAGFVFGFLQGECGVTYDDVQMWLREGSERRQKREDQPA
jgi:hypothetical protein